MENWLTVQDDEPSKFIENLKHLSRSNYERSMNREWRIECT